MLERWNSLIFENVREKLLDAAMEFLYNERSGEAFESQLVIGVRESFGEFCGLPFVLQALLFIFVVVGVVVCLLLLLLLWCCSQFKYRVYKQA